MQRDGGEKGERKVEKKEGGGAKRGTRKMNTSESDVKRMIFMK